VASRPDCCTCPSRTRLAASRSPGEVGGHVGTRRARRADRRPVRRHVRRIPVAPTAARDEGTRETGSYHVRSRWPDKRRRSS
jgi:hypothetical protein